MYSTAQLQLFAKHYAISFDPIRAFTNAKLGNNLQAQQDATDLLSNQTVIESIQKSVTSAFVDDSALPLAVLYTLKCILTFRIDDIMLIEDGETIIKDTSDWTEAAKLAVNKISCHKLPSGQSGVTLTVESKIAAAKLIIQILEINRMRLSPAQKAEQIQVILQQADMSGSAELKQLIQSHVNQAY